MPPIPYTLFGPEIATVIFDRTTLNTIAGLNRVPTDSWVLDYTPAPVPEPSTFLLLGGGLAGLAFYARRRKKE
jgi:hypothetical protein